MSWPTAPLVFSPEPAGSKYIDPLKLRRGDRTVGQSEPGTATRTNARAFHAKEHRDLLDGTGNDFDKPETDSNVVKLYNTLQICDEQIAYYHPGVGTLGAPNVNGRLAKWWSKVLGLAIGKGLLDNVGDAYRYLMNTYKKGDNIFIFGFSRGAYTARAVGSLLHVFGLLNRGTSS